MHRADSMEWHGEGMETVGAEAVNSEGGLVSGSQGYFYKWFSTRHAVYF